MKLFKDLNLNSKIQIALDQLGFTEPTEIQQKAIPMLLSENVDFHGQAQTGTGKTLAFGIPLAHKIETSNNKVQTLIVAPTRELVLQISDSLKKVISHTDIKLTTIFGGNSMVKQIDDLRRGVHIVVGTPGRLNDHLRRKTLSLKDLKVLVLDEADIMLDMGFKEEIDEILTFAPVTKKIWLFSATVKQGISDLKNRHMNNVVTVRVSQNNVGTTNTQQFYCVTTMGSRINALCRVIDSDPEFYGFIFCPTKALTAEIAEKL
jgi:ATP-dependent RNA helicase DeaD